VYTIYFFINTLLLTTNVYIWSMKTVNPYLYIAAQPHSRTAAQPKQAADRQKISKRIAFRRAIGKPSVISILFFSQTKLSDFAGRAFASPNGASNSSGEAYGQQNGLPNSSGGAFASPNGTPTVRFTHFSAQKLT
jgi:hypothetical protein